MRFRFLLFVLLITPAVQGQLAAFRCVDKAHPHETFSDKSYRFMLESLALSPVNATQAGYHEHHGVSLDAQLDDFSMAENAKYRALLVAGRACFASTVVMDEEEKIDLALIRDAIASQLFALDRKTYRDHPQDYVETIGSGLFFPLTQTSGTATSRLTAVVSRMEQVPRALRQAKANLVAGDPVFIDAAIEENDGNKDVVEMVGTQIAALPTGDAAVLKPRYDAVAKAANAAMVDFGKFLKDDLAKRPHTSTWRTGKDYATIFKNALGPGAADTPASLLASAEQEQDAIRARMFALAEPLHRQWFAGHDHSALTGDALEKQVITEVIDKIDEDHTTPERLIDTVKEQAKSIRAFIVAKDFIQLDDPDVNIVPTPEFLRGIYSVAGAYEAPALDATGSSQYWVTPIDAKTPAKDAESKLREYNNWMLQYLTMHEALPGHYTQFGHAKTVMPVSRRIIRNLFGSGPYTEGWGDYSVKEMIDAGYSATATEPNDPRFLLMFLKIRMRVATNAVLDIRMQSMGMTDDEALDMMEHKAFQSHAEAVGKLRRAKLSSGQLITYFVGYRQWNEMRAAAETAAGAGFDLKEFNEVALDEGPLPVPLLEPIVVGKMKR